MCVCGNTGKRERGERERERERGRVMEEECGMFVLRNSGTLFASSSLSLSPFLSPHCVNNDSDEVH